jgi:predicted DNA-binding antitoxin AbrB/MazE fold protein
MQIEAIYDHGVLTFSQPVYLYEQPVKVIVENILKKGTNWTF